MSESDSSRDVETRESIYLTAKQVRARYGHISSMTLWQWLRDPELRFPQPVMINQRRYFLVCTLDDFDARQTTRQNEVA